MDDQELERQYHPENFENVNEDNECAFCLEVICRCAEIESPFNLDLERLFGGRSG